MIRDDRPFDRWIKAQPGRCRVCGFDPPTQGHDPDCTVPKRRIAQPARRPSQSSRSSWTDRDEPTWIDRM